MSISKEMWQAFENTPRKCCWCNYAISREFGSVTTITVMGSNFRSADLNIMFCTLEHEEVWTDVVWGMMDMWERKEYIQHMYFSGL